MRNRDAIDSGREVAPLRAADDAVVVTTDGMGFEEVVDLVAGLATVAAITVPEGGAAAAATGQPAVDATGPVHLEAARPAAPPRKAGAERPRDAPAAPGRRNKLLDVAMRLDNDQTMLVRMVARLCMWLGRALASVEIEGLERVPRRGAVIIAINHASNADTFVTGPWISEALRTRRIHWLGKRELFDWPVFGWVCAHGGVHPVDRSTADIEAYRLATRILERGYVLWIFPEGTRSPTGGLQAAKDGMAQLALRTGALILPVGINDADRVWPKHRRLPALLPRRRIRVRIGEPFLAADVVPPTADRRAAKTAATTAIMGRIAELLEPRQRGVYADAVRGASAGAEAPDTD